MSEKKVQKKPDQNQKPEKKPEPSVLGRKIEFESIDPFGWYTVVHPTIHDESRDLSLWLDNALSWLRKEAKMPYTWGLLHGLGKDRDITSPVVYFKDRYEALRFSWLYSGILQEKQ
jgi:hypothetical protein